MVPYTHTLRYSRGICSLYRMKTNESLQTLFHLVKLGMSRLRLISYEVALNTASYRWLGAEDDRRKY